MRVAVISDVHANLHALEAVRKAIARERVDEVWCLGDLVGYGPKPNECCDMIEGWASLSLAGNHDYAAIGELPLQEFSASAAAAATWTKTELNSANRDYLSGLAPLSRLRNCELFHGGPREPVWEYLLTDAAIESAFELTSETFILAGHTHMAIVASLDGRNHAYSELAPDGAEIDLSHGRWLLNPGSVGQPRDSDPRASFLLLDLDARRAEFKRAEYEIAKTQAEMRKRGLPEQLASRLSHGL